MTLAEFIAKLGDRAASERFGMPEATIKAYRLGLRKPRGKIALTMIQKSGGELDWAGIYGPSNKRVLLREPA